MSDWFGKHGPDVFAVLFWGGVAFLLVVAGRGLWDAVSGSRVAC